MGLGLKPTRMGGSRALIAEAVQGLPFALIGRTPQRSE